MRLSKSNDFNRRADAAARTGLGGAGSSTYGGGAGVRAAFEGIDSARIDATSADRAAMACSMFASRESIDEGVVKEVSQ